MSETDKAIELYYWPTPNGWKITIMLEECGLPYVIRPVNIAKGDQFKPEFLKISPNNRMPAIVDPDGPDGAPISLFESGAILQYLGEKTGRFYPQAPRQRFEVNCWLFWQMAGLGPMAGQANHFRRYAPEQLPYAIERYTNEVHRLFGVLDTRLDGRDFICDDYSIADMACWAWVDIGEMQGQNFDEFPNLKAWRERVGAREAVKAGRAVGKDLGRDTDMKSEDTFKLLFQQRARR